MFETAIQSIAWYGTNLLVIIACVIILYRILKPSIRIKIRKGKGRIK